MHEPTEVQVEAAACAFYESESNRKGEFRFNPKRPEIREWHIFEWEELSADDRAEYRKRAEAVLLAVTATESVEAGEKKPNHDKRDGESPKDLGERANPLPRSLRS